MGIEELKKEIKNIREPRRIGYGNIRHKLEDIIIIGLCTIICGGEDFADMEAFGKSRQEYLAKFLELPNGIPDSDTFRRVFEKLNPSELSSCLINWISVERNSRETVAIDGKTICGSGNDKHRAYHVVSAFVAENHLTLGEICVEEKTNEITAVPELLDLIDVKGDIVTADAMSCQKKNTGKRTFQPCVRDCRVKPTAFRRGLATESLTVPQERPKEKESPEHSSGGHPSRHINYNTDSDHPCQSPFRPGKQGVNQSSLCFHCHKDRHTGQHTHHTYQSVLTV